MQQRIIVACVLVLGTLALITLLLYLIFGKKVVWGFIASLLAGLATGVGALPVLFMKKVPDKVFSGFLGIAAGVMLAATVFALIIPGKEYGDLLWPGKGVYIVVIGMLIGVLFLEIADRTFPHAYDHPLAVDEDSASTLRRIWMFILVITVHNFPEGIAVGVNYGAGEYVNGLTLAIAIGIQNMPEGLAVAMPLLAVGYSPTKALLIGTLSGMVEPIGGLLGAISVSMFQDLLPIAMGFAAGAMLHVISEEIIPQVHENGRSRIGTFCLIAGFIVMLILENVLG
ncbi:MAG TPA: ZIP family metal transporter [Crenotrichaceae bacterium]|nr:ZIP family metal transporter [Crenotrichaceae bacterium]